jgi:hypothetical protein
MMSKDEIVVNMIKFIDDAERDLQASRLSNDSKLGKNDIVNSILDELDGEVSDEN